MRILLTVDPEIPVPPTAYGGIERIVDWLARGLYQRGHEVGLLAHPASSCEIKSRFGWCVNTSRAWPEGWKAAYQLNQVVRGFRPDVVHSFSRLFYLFGLLGRGEKIVMSYQREPTGRTVAGAARIFGNRIQFTGCSEYISKRGAAFGGHWTAIPNGVEPCKYPFREKVQNDAPLVFLSRVESMKGTDWAIKIARLSGRRLIIAGNHAESGVQAVYWREKILPHVGRDGVEYIGPVNDSQKSELLGSAAAMIVPIQWNEPFGIVFAEALACGTPVISCPRGALPEIIESGLHGFLINSVEEGVDAVARLDEISREACRLRYEEKFSSDVIVSQYEELYLHL